MPHAVVLSTFVVFYNHHHHLPPESPLWNCESVPLKHQLRSPSPAATVLPCLCGLTPLGTPSKFSSFGGCLISRGVTSSGPIHVLARVRTAFLFEAEERSIPSYVWTTFRLSAHPPMASWVASPFGYCDWHCQEHGRTSVSSRPSSRFFVLDTQKRTCWAVWSFYF